MVSQTMPLPWQARWIWQEDDKSPNNWVCFRHDFQLNSLPPTASLWCACADKYWLWINGRMVVREGGLKSGPTRSSWYVDALDVTEFLERGRNQIAVLAWFWGHESASHRNARQAGLLFHLDAGETTVASDATWRVKQHPAFGQKGGGVSVTLAEQAVDFDARRDLGSWTAAEFDDSQWPQAFEKGKPPQDPWGELLERPVPFWRDGDPRRYTNAAELALPAVGPTKLVGRLPANIQVYPRFRLRGQAGQFLKIQVERDKKTTLYTTGEGEQEWEVPTWGNGHYVTYDVPTGVELLDISYRETGYNTTFCEEFSCSDEDLTRLWRKAARTAYVCMRDTFMDCPDRERSPWIGDIANTTEVVLRALDRGSDALIRKSFRELAGWATPAGNLWSAVPTSRFEGTFREFPSQTLLALGFGLRSYWMHSADGDLVRDFYPAARRYLLDLWTLENGIVDHRGAWETAWGVGVQSWYDWGTNIDAHALDNVLYFGALGTLQQLALAQNLPDDVARCRQVRSEMLAAFDPHFWVAEQLGYRSPRHSGPPDERVQALAFLTGIAPGSRQTHIAQGIQVEGHCSIYMERFPLEALVKMGYPEKALRRLKTRFSHEIASLYSTLPEQFGEDSNHAWGGAAICLLADALCGIEVKESGGKRFSVSPPKDGLDWAETTVPTPLGALHYAFRHETNLPSGNQRLGRWTHHLVVPAGVVVELRLPGSASCISVNQQQWLRGYACPFASLLTEDSAQNTTLQLGEGLWQIEELYPGQSKL